MGVILTDEWMKKDFNRPVQMMERLKSTFNNTLDANMIYHHLLKHGMYSPNKKTKLTWEHLKENNAWEKTQSLFTSYKKLWGGPDVPIYIFPLMSSGMWNKMVETKSGLAFKDKLFLFYDKGIAEKEMEAILIHEYHHVCRLHHLKKDQKEFTLLDTMIMEGLAERTVGKYLGAKYLAKWTKLYQEDKLREFWSKHLQEKHTIKRTDPLHDVLLLGMKGYPHMLGYCSGYYLVRNSEKLSVKKSFIIQSEEFLSKKN
ncbi:DUF2268 domain-containing putative Zn-dependent protease [Peribacillus simplex]|uniref:DUF2268 domain-containing putative Zn-dependent protease n=1 Tax=Peribacillus simplex TaxID=1478 RepID=A0AAW7IFB9_9BACI|nr:DUF2268 domain-containing putative Zn-dependent protease [Peribacillus simplex]AMM92144.1 hypothetical protein UP17_05965 [Peribacillus simplex]MDM5295820.1 DUF2268 domain-containing putative Zn-dependent protease [Peribacillus simplex]MDM5454825.1 DUF2268 domain-containing putative Zn-dependent protease [Peribacillus simplex]SNT35391.1 Uncharacterized protein YjaZ [Bacillus sp. OK838]